MNSVLKILPNEIIYKVAVKLQNDKLLALIEPDKQLHWYKKYYEHLPEQRSEQWKIERIHKIGGSQIANILGKGYSGKTQCIKDILLGSKFKGNAATNWGSFFEQVAVQFIQRYCGTKLHEFGSIPGLKIDGNVVTSYSPDGISWIDKESDIPYLLEQYDESVLGKNVLWEIKCPYRRAPKSEIPEHYIYQPLMGMETISVVQKAIFADFMFRMCSFEDFGFNSKYFKHTRKKSTEPIAICMLAVYSKNEYKLKSFKDYKSPGLKKIKIKKNSYASTIKAICTIENQIRHKNYSIYEMATICRETIIGDVDKHILSYFDIPMFDGVDLSGGAHPWYRYCNKEVCSTIISDVVSGSAYIEISPFYFTQPDIVECIGGFPTENLVGFMPVKLVSAKFIQVKSDPNFKDVVIPRILKCAELIKKILSTPDWETKVDDLILEYDE
jgi:hypothetical protein